MVLIKSLIPIKCRNQWFLKLFAWNLARHFVAGPQFTLCLNYCNTKRLALWCLGCAWNIRWRFNSDGRCCSGRSFIANVIASSISVFTHHRSDLPSMDRAGLLRSGRLRWTTQSHSKVYEIQARLMQLHPLLAALSLSLTNPKAIFFFIAFFSQFIQSDFEYPGFTLIYLATVLQIMSMAYLMGLILVGQYFSEHFKNHRRFTAGLWILAGLLFIGFALRLIFV